MEDFPGAGQSWLFTAGPGKKHPAGVHIINPKRLNDQFVTLLESLKMPTDRKHKGFVIHSLRHFFETCYVNSGVPPRAVDALMGHAPDKSMAAVSYPLGEDESQTFMKKVTFGTSPSAADAEKEMKK